MANHARNSKLVNKRRFTRILQLVPSGDGSNLKAGRIAVRTLKPHRIIEMVSIKPEETLHEYLRRHFEKISRVKARQFVEQKELPEGAAPNTKTLNRG
jgi:hypothetical protein